MEEKLDIFTSMQKLPSLIFLDKIAETFSWIKITYFLLRYSMNVGGRDQITVTNDHKLAFVVRNSNRFFIVYRRPFDPHV